MFVTNRDTPRTDDLKETPLRVRLHSVSCDSLRITLENATGHLKGWEVEQCWWEMR